MCCVGTCLYHIAVHDVRHLRAKEQKRNSAGRPWSDPCGSPDWFPTSNSNPITMMTALLKKLLGPVALVLVGIVGGAFVTMKMQKPVTVPAAPDCICPEPSVSVQPFDVDKIKGVKSFVYQPQFSGSIQVAGVDSTALRKMIDKSMDEAFQRYMAKGKPALKNRFRQSFKEADSAFNMLTPELIEKIAMEAADRNPNQLRLEAVSPKIKQLTE